MLKGNRAVAIVLALSLVGLGAGVLHLIQLRFSAGDVYPPYSSLRADPLGSKALWESLQQMPGVKVRRSFEPLEKLKESSGTTLMLAGVPAREFRTAFDWELRDLEHFAVNGGRVVITIIPEAEESALQKQREEFERQHPRKGSTRERKLKDPGKQDAKKGNEKSNPDLPRGVKKVELKDAWSLGIEYKNLSRDADGRAQPAEVTRKVDDSGLPEKLNWHSAIRFDKPDDRWRVIYDRDSKPVVVERRMGSGSIVVLTDSWHISNEALRKDRESGLLAWIVGSKPNIIFDETHLGVQVEEGVATLARKYRLHGLFLGLLLLATLYIWQNASTFVPPAEVIARETTGDQVHGRDSASGFVNMLRRGVRPQDILKTCFEEWLKTNGRGGSGAEKHLAAMRAAYDADHRLEARDRRPVETYRQMCHMLAPQFKSSNTRKAPPKTT